MNKVKIPCYFIEPDARALAGLINIVIRESIMIADIGSWAGYSVLASAKAVMPYHGKVFAIDHWMGSPGAQTEDIAKQVDMYSVFKQRMVHQGLLWDIVHPLVMDSVTAASIFRDNILDLVFIDADHRYEYVKQDILSWLPKVKGGGILCGHDIYKHYSTLSKETRDAIDNSLDRNTIFPVPELCIHPGVTKALHDLFGDQYSIIPNSSIWAMQVRVLNGRDQIIARHPESFKEGHHINVEVCQRMLLDIKEIFDAMGIRFWLWFGTFLGPYRDGKLIPSDGDIDLAVYSEDMGKVASCNDLFINKGFEFAPEPDSVLYRDGEHADLNTFYLEGTKRVNGYYRIDADAFEAENWVDFLGKSWRIVSEPERWLAYLYGPDWRIPKKDFVAPGRPLGEADV